MFADIIETPRGAPPTSLGGATGRTAPIINTWIYSSVASSDAYVVPRPLDRSWCDPRSQPSEPQRAQTDARRTKIDLAGADEQDPEQGHQKQVVKGDRMEGAEEPWFTAGAEGARSARFGTSLARPVPATLTARLSLCDGPVM